ncbi:MAG: type III-B CRISPR-associated protein Cas10/Cmr2 [Ktedonobacteraceae bacterium]
MTQYMLLFSLGPVQSFIAQARKTRDLWLGSFLLSALMQESMKHIHPHLVFPYKPIIEKNIPDLPNKYIAIFNDVDDAVKAARESEGNIKKSWQAICNEVWDEVLKKPAYSPITRTQWDNQTNPANVFEIFWVVVAGSADHYKEWLAETQLMFDRRKHLRDFKQQEESGEKSTISGLRAALRGPGELRTDVQTFWYQVAQQQSAKDISGDGTERLDAIDTVKRFAHLSKSLAQLLHRKEVEAGFPSTSSIAAATFIEGLIRSSDDASLRPGIAGWLQETAKLDETMPATIPLLEDLAKDYTRGVTILKRDGDCYFPETFSSNRLKKEFRFDDSRKKEREQLAKDGPEAVSRLLKATDALTPPITRPTSYYAMIQMDGDRMGKLINGVKDKEQHRAVNQALSVFSRKHAPALVEGRYPGRLIYAGGDDVFALAPLARDYVQEGAFPPIKTVLDLVNQLQEQYCKQVRDVFKDASDGPAETHTASSRKAPQITMSAGIAIAHHYTSLSYVRRMSKDAEKLAKDHYGRNALVVTVLRRSGEQTRVGCRWHYQDLIEEAQPVLLFLSFYDLFREDVLSPKCVFNLLEEAPTLLGLEQRAQSSEIKRVLRRQRSTGMEGRLSDEEIARKAEYLVALAQAMDKAAHEELSDSEKERGLALELHADSRRYGLVEVLGWLLVMLFLARKEQE